MDQYFFFFIIGDTLYLSGGDMIDGTPILDLKPYLPSYDCPLTEAEEDNSNTSKDSAGTPSWIKMADEVKLTVRFTPTAQSQLTQFSHNSTDPKYRLEFMESAEELQLALIKILSADPRSVYRSTKCSDRLYYFTVDKAHVTCWFDDDDNVVEILKVNSTASVPHLRHKALSDMEN